MLSTLLAGALAAGAAYAGLVAWLYATQERRVFLPTRAVAHTPRDAGLPYEDVTIGTADGETLRGWLVRHSRPRGTVLFLHGNAGDIGDRVPTAALLQRQRVDVLLVDYRGYGRSSGRPSEEGTYCDAEAMWRYLTETRGVAPERIVVHGRSLGGAVAAWLAARTRPGGVILESTFTSLPDVAARLYPFLPVRRLMRVRYPLLEHLRGLRSPLLVVHSEDDRLVPFEHARAILEAAPVTRKRLVAIRGSHEWGFQESGAAYERAIAGFLDEVLGP